MAVDGEELGPAVPYGTGEGDSSGGNWSCALSGAYQPCYCSGLDCQPDSSLIVGLVVAAATDK